MSWWNREARLDKELRFHLDQHTADLIAQGCEPAEARRLARLALGGPEQVKEQCRDVRTTRWLEDLWQDLRYTLRTLRQKPGFTAVTLLTLALGSGATSVMFTVINSVLLRPLAYPEPEKLMTAHEHTDKYGDQWGFAYPSFRDFQRESRSLALAAWTYGGGTVSEPGEPEYVSGRQISAELFSVLGVRVPRGRAFRPADDQPGSAPSIIISDSLWRRRFGESPMAIGKPLVVDGMSYVVVGVAPAGLQLDGEADVFTPLGQSREPRMQNRGAHFLHVVARLLPSVTLPEAQSEVAVIARHRAAEYPKFDAGRGIRLVPLQQELVGNVQSTLWLLLGAVGFLLLIACVNVASLLLARAVSREREFAMRMALGAQRSRLVRQNLTESAVLGLCGGALGIALAAAALRPFVLLWPGGLPRAAEIRIDWRVLLFATAASLLCGILFGLAPAFRAPVSQLERSLRSGARSVAQGSRRLHGGFVISEIALAVVLLVSAGILGRTLLRLSSLDPGVNVRNVLVARVAISPGALADPALTREAWQNVLDRAQRVPGAQWVALTDIIPMREGENMLSYWTSSAIPPPNEAPVALASTVTPDDFKVMGIPLRQGRFFDQHDRLGGEPVVIIDEAMAQHAFGRKDVVGKRLWSPALGSGPVRIVGVVGHVRHWGLAGDDLSIVHDQMYYPFAQVPGSLMHFFSTVMSIAVRTNVPPLSVVEPLRRELRGSTGDQVLYEVRTLEQLASASLDRQRFLLLLFGLLAGSAMLLACIGIYGVMAYLTSQQIPEIGIRLAVGATAGGVLWLVLRQSLRLVLTGAAAGIVAAIGAGQLLQRLVEGARPTDPLTLVTMTSVLVCAAMWASFLPARRASRVDPVIALRND